MIRKAFFLTVALLLPAPSQAQVKLLRHPTYSNGKVAFSYLGDLWIANENGSGVQRLTDNQARDVYPRFSPDGNWIAFSSNREGNYDVYVIPATGGKPRQLTFHSADDNVVNWTPDGKNIIFTSARGNGVFPSVTTLRSEEHTSELQSLRHLVCRLLLEKKNKGLAAADAFVFFGATGDLAHKMIFPALFQMVNRGILLFFLMIGRPPKSTLFPYRAFSR